MHVDWNWIKQRPHFIAERFAKYYNVLILYRHKYNRIGLQRRKSDEIKLNPIYVLPGESKLLFLKKVNICLFRQLVKRQIKKFMPDVIYLTSPTQVRLLPRNFTGSVIYDCMDNHVAFLNNVKKKKLVQKSEQKLCDVKNGE